MHDHTRKDMIQNVHTRRCWCDTYWEKDHNRIG